MSNIAAYLSKAMLDWSLGGAAATRPSMRAVGLSLGLPSSTSASEVGTGSGYSRQTGAATLFSAVSLSVGFASNNTPLTFGSFSSSAVIQGLCIFDTTATGGNMLYYGSFVTARTVLASDLLVIDTGGLVIQLS